MRHLFKEEKRNRKRGNEVSFLTCLMVSLYFSLAVSAERTLVFYVCQYSSQSRLD